MPEVKFIEQSGERILLIDFSRGSGGQGIAETAEKAMQMVRSSGQPHSIRGLIDFTGTRLNRLVRDSMMKMSKNNGPFMKSVAFVGLGAVLSPIFKGLLYLTKRRNHRVYRTRGEAFEWLCDSEQSR
jgi:hypothetical protein